MYTVFGYDWDGTKFRFTFDSFIQAVKCYKSWSFTSVFIMRDTTGSCLFVR
jgi:hypothetical protein